jgi:hypothetical protein
MKLRITRPIDGSIDGIQLDQFAPGQIYEIGTSLASFLLSVEAAEPVDQDAAVTGTTLEQMFRPAHGASTFDKAADRDARGTRKNRDGQ